MIHTDPHPLLDAGAFTATFPRPLGELPSPEWLAALLRMDAVLADPSGGRTPPRDETVRTTVRDLLRHGGYKPTGRGKPSSEYLAAAAAEGRLTAINPAVDACNAVSLHSGLPISVVDLDLAKPPFRIGLAAAGQRYPFNPSGQEIDLEGLLCLFDAEGPCANWVKDSQRTKTHAGTARTLSVVWGSKALGDRTSRTVAWYRELLTKLGAETSALTVPRPSAP